MTINDIKINNIEIYNSGMQKSILDKLWFLSLIEDNNYNFIDYGCADASLMKMMHKINPNYNYYGYDISNDMLNIARQNFHQCKYHCKWKELISEYNNQHKGILNISSLIHEVYSYCNDNSIVEFWNNIFESIDFEYIAIRDMCINQKTQRIANDNDVAKVYHYADQDLLNDFEQQWGSIQYLPNMLHWFLKYRYRTNWHREIKENYLPLTLEDLYRKINLKKYRIIYQEHYTLPYLKKSIQNDFDVDIKENTHIKILLQRT